MKKLCQLVKYVGGSIGVATYFTADQTPGTVILVKTLLLGGMLADAILIVYYNQKPKI